MPKAITAKTVSAPKLASLLVAAILVAAFVAPRMSSAESLGQMRIGPATFHVLRADTPEQQLEGLSGRTTMPQNEAMLFTFGKSQVQCFWMKDMRFSLDMIWLDANKQVTHIESKVTPDTYPETFCPETPAAYVVEVNSGTAECYSLHVGDKVTF